VTRASTVRDRPAASGPPPAVPRRAWLRAIGIVAAGGLVLLALYLAHPLLGGRRLPIGPDGPVYTWWTHLAAAEGLGVIPFRPAVPGLALVLGALFGTEPIQTLAYLGPVLAAAAGLAGGALLETSLGPATRRAVAGILLVGAFAGYLAAGWLANLSLTVLFLGALAVLATAPRSWRAVAAAAGLLAAAGLSHAPFLFAALAVLGGVAVVHLPELVADVQAGKGAWDTMAARLTVAGSAGAAGAAAGFGLLASEPVRAITSQDALLRRIGLRDTLASWLRDRLLVDGRRAVVPFAAAGWLAAEARRRSNAAAGAAPGVDPIGRRYFWALCGSWAVVTVVGLAVLAVTARGPANRLLPFAFFVPLAAAVGVHHLLTTTTTTRARRIAALAAGAAIVLSGLYAWVDRPPYVEEDELVAARAAARSVAHLPPGTPLVFVVDTSEKAAGFHVVRFSNVIRMELPPERIRDLRIAVARPSDYLAGRSTNIGDLEHDRISQATVAETADLGAHGAVLVVQPFNEPGFGQAVGLGTVVGPDVVSLRGGRPVGDTGSTEERPGLGPGPLILLSVASLAVLWIFGVGWARWALSDAGTVAIVCAAPSAGLAVAVFGALAADRLGLAVGGPAGPAAAIALALLGYAAAAVAGRRRRLDTGR
jgi:hypothetical protein